MKTTNPKENDENRCKNPKVMKTIKVKGRTMPNEPKRKTIDEGIN